MYESSRNAMYRPAKSIFFSKQSKLLSSSNEECQEVLQSDKQLIASLILMLGEKNTHQNFVLFVKEWLSRKGYIRGSAKNGSGPAPQGVESFVKGEETLLCRPVLKLACAFLSVRLEICHVDESKPYTELVGRESDRLVRINFLEGGYVIDAFPSLFNANVRKARCVKVASAQKVSFDELFDSSDIKSSNNNSSKIPYRLNTYPPQRQLKDQNGFNALKHNNKAKRELLIKNSGLCSLNSNSTDYKQLSTNLLSHNSNGDLKGAKSLHRLCPSSFDVQIEEPDFSTPVMESPAHKQAIDDTLATSQPIIKIEQLGQALLFIGKYQVSLSNNRKATEADKKYKPVVLDKSDQFLSGKLKFYSDRKKFGFVQLDDKKEIFLHKDNLMRSNVDSLELENCAKFFDVLLRFKVLSYKGKRDVNSKAVDIEIVNFLPKAGVNKSLL